MEVPPKPAVAGLGTVDRFREPAEVGFSRMILRKENTVIITPELVTAISGLVTATAGLIWAFRRKR